ncbi:MAG: ABC-2 family transporter protein [bacterium]|nr:ABC-2 family transporter protein [bacterium]
MRYFRILLLHFQRVFEHRMRSFVWFLVSLYNPLIYILFWKGAFLVNNGVINNWTMSSMTSYFFLLTIIASTLMAHIEEDVCLRDIQEGQLTQYLLKPFSYFLLKFFEEMHYRLLQGGYGLLLLIVLTLIFGPFIIITHNITVILFAVVIAILAYLLSFIFKMTIGFIAFWTVDIMGVFLFVDIVLSIFTGLIVPIEFLFHPLNIIARFLPFSYMIYYPVLAFQGKLSILELFNIAIIQLIWIIFFTIIYQIMWKKGIKKFSGVSQ